VTVLEIGGKRKLIVLSGEKEVVFEYKTFFKITGKAARKCNTHKINTYRVYLKYWDKLQEGLPHTKKGRRLILVFLQTFSSEGMTLTFI
jgi:hypothetical protein